MAFALVTPGRLGDTISVKTEASINADAADSKTQKFFMKIGSYQINAKNQPFDVTNETDTTLDVRNLNYLTGSFRLSGWVVGNEYINVNNLRGTNSESVGVKLNLGKYEDDGDTSVDTRAIEFVGMVNSVQLQFQRTAPFIPVSISGIIVGEVSSNNTVVETGVD